MTRAALTQFLIALGVAAALLAAYALWYIAVDKAREDTAAVLAELGEKEAARARTAVARAELAELSSEEEFVRTYFVPTADIVPFLERLESTGEDAGAAISVVSVSGEKDSSGSIAVALTITGSFPEVMHALGAIEYGPYAIRTENLTITSGGDGTWSASGTFRIGTREDLVPTP